MEWKEHGQQLRDFCGANGSGFPINHINHLLSISA